MWLRSVRIDNGILKFYFHNGGSLLVSKQQQFLNT